MSDPPGHELAKQISRTVTFKRDGTSGCSRDDQGAGELGPLLPRLAETSLGKRTRRHFIDRFFAPNRGIVRTSSYPAVRWIHDDAVF